MKRNRAGNRITRWTPRSLVLLAGGLAVLLAACASDPEPEPDPDDGAPLADADTAGLEDASAERPASYDEFVSVTEYGSLAEAISKERFVWLPPGSWPIDNPLVISRSTPLYLHGGDRTHTRITGRDPSRPLFEVERAPLIQISGVMLKPAAERSAQDATLLVARNGEPTHIEIADCRLNEGAVEMRGPGSLRLQNTLVRPMGWLTHALLLDHPDARLTVVGGDISNLRSEPRIDTRAAYHIHARRGRLRIYGLSIEAALGPADFRIDSASSHGPHVLSAVRSEGNNGANKGAHRSTMVEVPPSSERVDLLMKSNIGAWGAGGYGRGRLVEYGAAGTVWMVGNNTQKGANALVEGRAPNSTLVAIGNFVFDDAGILPVAGARRFQSGNVYFHMLRERTRLGSEGLGGEGPELDRRVKRDKPLKRFVERDEALRASVPPVPDDEIPAPLTRPVLRRPLPGMLSATDFGAKGDGAHDDTSALQSLLDAQCGRHGSVVFLPPGRYRTTAALRYNTPDAACQHATGGWIAGAGRDASFIERDPAKPGSVLVTRSMSGVMIQGLTFRAAPWRRDEPGTRSESVFDLGGGRGVGPATHYVSFYDTRFDGGKYGLGLHLYHEGGNGEGNLIVDSEFRNSYTGLGVGGFNVLNNIVYRSEFVDNEIAIGHGEEGKLGGIWTIYGAKVTGTGHALFAFRGAAAGAWYFEDLDAEAPRIVDRRSSGGSFPLLFDRSHLRGAAAQPIIFDSAQNGGPIFLHSQIDDLRMTLNGRTRALYAINLGSRVTGWERSRANGSHARLYELSE